MAGGKTEGCRGNVSLRERKQARIALEVEEAHALLANIGTMHWQDALELLFINSAVTVSKRTVEAIQKAAAAKALECMAKGRHLEAVRLLIQTQQRDTAQSALETSLALHADECDPVRKLLLEMQADIAEI